MTKKKKISKKHAKEIKEFNDKIQRDLDRRIERCDALIKILEDYMAPDGWKKTDEILGRLRKF